MNATKLDRLRAEVEADRQAAKLENDRQADATAEAYAAGQKAGAAWVNGPATLDQLKRLKPRCGRGGWEHHSILSFPSDPGPGRPGLPRNAAARFAVSVGTPARAEDVTQFWVDAVPGRRWGQEDLDGPDDDFVFGFADGAMAERGEL